jgi:hypothetical protein
MAAAGKPLEEDDVISNVLTGLNDDAYNGFVAAITALRQTNVLALVISTHNFYAMRPYLKIKTLLEILQSMRQQEEVGVATTVDMEVGVETSPTSNVATSIVAMNNMAMSSIVMITVEATIHMATKAAMMGAAKGTTHNSSLEVKTLSVKFVAKLATLLSIARKGFKKIIVARRSLLVLPL